MQKIAIIIPYYNEERRMSEAVLNELLQLASADIYPADDGSTDNTLQKLKPLPTRTVQGVLYSIIGRAREKAQSFINPSGI